MVSPKVAAAAAARALEVLGEDDPAVLAEAQYMSVDDSDEKEKGLADKAVSNGETDEKKEAPEGTEGGQGKSCAYMNAHISYGMHARMSASWYVGHHGGSICLQRRALVSDIRIAVVLLCSFWAFNR